MPPAASILIPTRRRRDYLAVALASAAPQAAERGAELIVVEDDPADPETEKLAPSTAPATSRTASRGGSTRRATRRSTLAGGELLCFLDDDAVAWPGWLVRCSPRRRRSRSTRHSGARSARNSRGRTCMRAAVSRCR